MSSLRCKRCGNPVSDAYAKWSYCTSCGKQKQRIEHFNIFFRALGILFLIPILVGFIFALAHVNSSLTLYAFILIQGSFVTAALVGVFYTSKSLSNFDKSK
jgi:hypothetical protein